MKKMISILSIVAAFAANQVSGSESSPENRSWAVKYIEDNDIDRLTALIESGRVRADDRSVQGNRPLIDIAEFWARRHNDQQILGYLMRKAHGRPIMEPSMAASAMHHAVMLPAAPAVSSSPAAVSHASSPDDIESAAQCIKNNNLDTLSVLMEAGLVRADDKSARDGNRSLIDIARSWAARFNDQSIVRYLEPELGGSAAARASVMQPMAASAMHHAVMPSAAPAVSPSPAATFHASSINDIGWAVEYIEKNDIDRLTALIESGRVRADDRSVRGKRPLIDIARFWAERHNDQRILGYLMRKAHGRPTMAPSMAASAMHHAGMLPYAPAVSSSHAAAASSASNRGDIESAEQSIERSDLDGLIGLIGTGRVRADDRSCRDGSPLIDVAIRLGRTGAVRYLRSMLATQRPTVEISSSGIPSVHGDAYVEPSPAPAGPAIAPIAPAAPSHHHGGGNPGWANYFN